MAAVCWTEPALKDVQTLAAFIARDSPAYSRKLAARIVRAARRLEKHPRVGWMVPEFELDPFREILVPPYRIIYRLDDDVCSILAVIHGSRDLAQHVDPAEYDSGES